MGGPDAREGRTSAAGRRVRQALLLAALAGGVLCTAYALYDGWRHADRVQRSLGLALPGWLALVGVFGLVQMAAIGSVLRRPECGGAPLRWGLVAGAVFWLGYLALAQPLDLFVFETALAGASGLFAAGVLLAPWLRPLGRRRAVGIAHVALFQVALTAVLLELALAALARLEPSPLLACSDGQVLDRLATYAFPPGFVHLGFPCNALGHYDAEFLPRARRSRPAVLMIGDSFSASVVPHRYHFTTVCEQLLGEIELYNMGVAGIGPEEYQFLLSHEGLPLQPDAVIVNVYTANDLIEARADSAGTRLVRQWFDRGNVRLWFVPQRLLWLATERRRAAVPGANEVDRVLATEAEIAAVYPWVLDHRLELATYSPERYLEIVGNQVHSTSPARPEKLAQLFAQLEAMRRSCGSVPFGVVLIPGEYQLEDRLWQAATAQLGDPSTRDDVQPRIAGWLAERGIPCLDLLPALRAAEPFEDGDRHCYMLRDTHFNVRGNGVAGRAMAPFVRGLLRDSAPRAPRRR